MKWLALVVVLGCKAKRLDDPMPEPPIVQADAGVARDAARPWPELEGYPRVAAERVISLPAKADTPRFTLAGPVLIDDLAIVASSQFGFAAVDWRRGRIVWTKPAGTRIAPPLVLGSDPPAIALVGDCAKPPEVGVREVLVGCLRVVTPTGTERTYIAIRGKASSHAMEVFAATRGEQHLFQADERTLHWLRADQTIAIDLITGVARSVPATPVRLAIAYQGKRWDIAQDADGRIVAMQGTKVAWRTENPYTHVVGAVWLPDMSPLLRVANANPQVPYIDLIDMDATGSLRAAVAKPTPGIDVLASATSSVGDAAVAVRLDSTLRRDFVVGYAANAVLMWVHPLPEHQRTHHVGIAIADEADAVVVFHDGDTVTVLPELSAPPTTPGATRAPSKNATP